MESRNGTFDAIVVGAGPAGGVVATRLSQRGMSIALVERELVGGECAYWACIPSKTLLRPGEVRHEARLAPGSGEPPLNFDDAVEYRDYMIRHLDDREEIEGYEKDGARVFKGAATLTGPGEVQVGDRRLKSERIVIATGSETQVPPIDGLEHAGYWTNREATTLAEMPGSVIVLGGGPVGIELAQLLRRFGAEVDLVESSERLLSREPPRVGELLGEALEGDGIKVHTGAKVAAVERVDSARKARFEDGRTVTAEQVIVASGRRPRLAGLGLENVGIEPTEAGIPVDERCRAGEGIWAVGDVTGEMPFTHVGMYQARVACADIAGEPVRADYSAVPRVVFSDPEVAAVGITAPEQDDGHLATVRLALRDAIARPWTYETEPRGELELLADRSARILVGAWAVGPLASEWIHYAALAIKAQVPIAVLKDSVAQFPTYTEAYLKALDRLEL